MTSVCLAEIKDAHPSSFVVQFCKRNRQETSRTQELKQNSRSLSSMSMDSSLSRDATLFLHGGSLS